MAHWPQTSTPVVNTQMQVACKPCRRRVHSFAISHVSAASRVACPEPSQHTVASHRRVFWHLLKDYSFHFAVKAAVHRHVSLRSMHYFLQCGTGSHGSRVRCHRGPPARKQSAIFLVLTARTIAGGARSRPMWYSITIPCATAITTLSVTASGGGDRRIQLEIKTAISSHIIPLLSHNQDGVIKVGDSLASALL